MVKVRKLPSVQYAMHWDGSNADAICAWSGATLDKMTLLIGTETAQLGDWLVKVAEQQFIVVTHPIFLDTYVLVSDDKPDQRFPDSTPRY